LRIFIDGDAFPNLLKPILLRAIEKKSIETIVVSNKKISIGESKLIVYHLVEQGADVADNLIAQMVEANELVITADIPLADKVIAKKAHAIDHRGELYSVENIKHYLAIRNLMDEIRSMGEITRGPAPFSKKDIHAFSNQLQKFLSRI